MPQSLGQSQTPTFERWILTSPLSPYSLTFALTSILTFDTIEIATTTPSRSRRSSVGGLGSAARRESGMTESTTFDYDEGDSITEPESEEEEEMDVELSTTSSRRSRGSPNKSTSSSKRGARSPGSSAKSTPANLTSGRGRRGSDRETFDSDLPFGDDDMDISVDSGSKRSSKRGSMGTSPFDAGASPVGANTSAMSAVVRVAKADLAMVMMM